MSIKNSNDTIGNRTRDLPACSAVPQPTAPPRNFVMYIFILGLKVILNEHLLGQKLLSTINLGTLITLNIIGADSRTESVK
jgi:hypothetical protein